MVGKEPCGRDLGAIERGIVFAGGEFIVGDERGTRHLPSARHDPQELKKRRRPAEHGVDVIPAGRPNPVDRRGQRRNATAQPRLYGREVISGRVIQAVCNALDVGDQGSRGLAVIAQNFSTDEVDRLDAGGAFVDRGDAGIAQVLGGAGLLDISHAAVNLQADGRDVDGRFPCSSP